MAEQADALGLGPSTVRCEGSSPSERTLTITQEISYMSLKLSLTEALYRLADTMPLELESTAELIRRAADEICLLERSNRDLQEKLISDLFDAIMISQTG